jgi:hypothetical protein
MPNVNSPNGLIPIGCGPLGGPIRTNLYTKPASDAAAIFKNDAVYAVADGQIKAGRAAAFVGVAINYGKASTLTEHLVVDNPDQLFEAQDDGDAGSFAAADVGLNADLNVQTGDTTLKTSKHAVDISTKQTTNTLDVQLLRLGRDPRNAFGQYARIEIRFNRHQLALGRTGV